MQAGIQPVCKRLAASPTAPRFTGHFRQAAAMILLLSRQHLMRARLIGLCSLRRAYSKSPATVCISEAQTAHFAVLAPAVWCQISESMASAAIAAAPTLLTRRQRN